MNTGYACADVLHEVEDFLSWISYLFYRAGCRCCVVAVHVLQAVGRLEAQVQLLSQELKHEQAVRAQFESGTNRQQAELEVQLLASKAAESALQQVGMLAAVNQRCCMDTSCACTPARLALPIGGCMHSHIGIIHGSPLSAAALQHYGSPMLHSAADNKQHAETGVSTRAAIHAT